jgi:ketosteroid isomerase-like protein
MSPFRLVVVFCLVAARAAAQAPESAPEPEPEAPAAEAPKPSVRDAVDAGNYFFMKAFEARDAQAIGELYTEDARVIAPGAPPAEGRESIVAFWKGGMEGTKSVRLETLSVESAGDLAFEEGVVHLTALDGSESSERYLVVWKRIGRRWHLHRDIWNSGPAAEPPDATP